VTEAEAAGLRALAFYLPQFHPIPENDAWWGRGFTEWTNVTRARPLFRGHYQPQLPADLGFYDLRVPEVRARQAELARAAGIHGFCYYHYWFGGRRLLERPFAEVLASGEPDFPFALCWANENWTRVWDGGDQEVLLQQQYSPADDLAHIRALAPAFADPRYIRVDGKPLFLVYKPEHLPEPKRTADIWRTEADRLGIGDVYLCRVELVGTRQDPSDFGFDAAVSFQPDPTGFYRPKYESWPHRIVRRIFRPWSQFRRNQIPRYELLVEESLARLDDPVDYVRFPCVSPSWDNSPRRTSGGAWIWRGATPDKYEHWLSEVVRRRTPRRPEEDLVFLNAWNEWAEGNHLEPCQKWGHAWLESTARVLRGASW
jgi:lipopolysaccharide biosynthesis protein